MWQISYPPLPANGASQGDYFLPKSHKLAVLRKNSLQKQLWQPNLQTFFSNIWSNLHLLNFDVSSLAGAEPLNEEGSPPHCEA